MIRDVETARQAVELVQEAHKLLMDSLALVRGNCSKEEYEAYRPGITQVTARLFFLIMEPIYRANLSLAPPDTPPDFLERWRRGESTTGH